jgi:CRISPR/Cas system CSM-associated protein Csm3 (group 7 of RAMP superfamily)
MSDDYRTIFEDHKDHLLAQTYARTQVQLSRVLGIAASDHLFTSEFAVEDLQFTSAITGWLEVTPIAGEASTGSYELLLLLAGLRMVNTIGGNVSRGAGWVSIKLPDTVKTGNQNTSWQEMLEYVDLLGEFDEEIRNA